MNMLRKRAFIGLLLFAWLPFVVRAVQIYFAANYPQTATSSSPTPRCSGSSSNSRTSSSSS